MRTDTILYTRTLDYYDGILLFEARDPIGGTYVASHLEPVPGGDRYLLVGCRPDDLHQFRHGAIALRNLMQNSAEYGWYLADLISTDRPLAIKEQGSEGIPEKYLPGDGITINEYEVDHETTKSARERDNAVIQVSIEPPEAAREYRVRADTLTGLINRVERLTRFAAEQVATEGTPGTPARTKIHAGWLEIVDISSGSIKVTFQEVGGLDTNRESLLAKAMQRLDDLFNDIDASERAEPALSKYDPKVTDAYVSLMKFLKAKRTGFSYTWATPTSQRPSHRSVSLERARRIAEQPREVIDIPYNETEGDEIVLEGILEMADEPDNQWRLRDHEHGVRAGTVGEDGPSLSNLVIDSRYRFVCVEEMQAVGRGGRRKPVLHLRSIMPL